MAQTREQFDALWTDWNTSPEGPRKQRLLNKITTDNYPLVQKFVSRLLRYSSVHCDKDDAMQAGLIGFIIALKKYDPKRPTRFSTMCYPWVRHEVTNMFLKQTPLYRPKGAGMPYKEYRKSEAIEAQNGREATPEELGVTPAKLAHWRSVVFHFVPMNEVKERNTDDGIGNYRNSDIMKSQDVPADEQLIQAETDHKLARALKSLSDTEYRILIEEDYFLPASVCEGIRLAAIEKVKKRLGSDP